MTKSLLTIAMLGACGLALAAEDSKPAAKPAEVKGPELTAERFLPDQF